MNNYEMDLLALEERLIREVEVILDESKHEDANQEIQDAVIKLHLAVSNDETTDANLLHRFMIADHLESISNYAYRCGAITSAEFAEYLSYSYYAKSSVRRITGGVA